MINLNKKIIEYLESKHQDVSDCVMYMFACKYELKYKCTEETFAFLTSEQFIKLDFVTNKIRLNIGLFESEIVDIPDTLPTIDKDIRDRIDEYRFLFKGIRPQSMGMKQHVIQLMIQFCLQHNKTLDEVIQTTKTYMDYTDTKLISNADNFISKLDKSGNTISLLEMAFEEQDSNSFSEVRTYKVI